MARRLASPPVWGRVAPYASALEAPAGPLGPLGNGIRGQTLAGAAAAFVAALFAAKFLERWFRTRTLTPFAIYCLVAGAISIVHFA
jgi:undecaprenyl pyrophosphate phosphatase UppP